MIHKTETFIAAAGKATPSPSSGLGTDQEACITWITNHPLGATDSKLKCELYQTGKDGFL